MADAQAVVRDLVTRLAIDLGLSTPRIRPHDSGGANYTSVLFSIDIDNLKLFAKVASIGEKLRQSMNAETLYKTEQLVYNELAKTYATLINDHIGAKPFRFPKIYASLADLGKETLVMEDLTSQGYKVPSRHDSIDWRFAAAAVSKLASFHALSFAYEREYPEEFALKAELFKYKHPERTPENEKMLEETLKKMLGTAIQVVRDEHKERLMKLVQNIEGFVKFKAPINRTVLVHGDYRASNLMFKELDGSLDIMVVDYQAVHSGSPVSDILYFTFLGTDQKFRRLYHEDLMTHYHEELGAALKGLGLDVEQEYPRKVFEEELKQMLPCTLQMAAMVLPLVTVEEGSAPQISGDADLKDIALPPNELFAQRFRALVDDCVEWGVL